AEVVEALTPAARRYAAFLMGDVIRADIATLKQHERSITADCMRYSSRTATRIREEVYRRWYIGREARERRLQEVREGIDQRGRRIETLLAATREAQARIEIISRVLRQLPVIEDLASADERLRTARGQAEELDRQIASVDTSSFEALRTQIAALADSIRAAEKTVGDLRERIGSLRSTVEVLGVRLQGEEADRERRESALGRFLGTHQADEADLVGYYDERMRGERRQADGRIDIADMIRRYESSHAGLRTRLDKARTDLRSAKQRYNHDENEILVLEDDESIDYLQRLSRYRETELPEYRDRISRARAEAEKQFREHFVSRLNEYLVEAEESFKEINHILETIRFGKDQYRFSIARNPEKQRLLSAISSAAEVRDLEGTLFSALKSDEERESIERLFTDVLTHELDDPAVRELCDYRQYFVYDIRIRHTDSLDGKTGKALESLLSRVLREKSGGETQTPYYVAIAASFHRFYKDAPGAIRLVLFDEAFSKMDDERIGTMIAFFRKLAMQVVTAVPTEKIESIAPHMDRTNLVVRRNNQAFVRDYAILRP
ncbi:MAG TPA: SbcC/MukB-like Walker B domain-containing protein, partial [Coriobacteriia bacterium]|nr:SbcC/MukB-like Walker B domain-containing protein [Coriobacteriia bacterium]